MFYVGSIFLLQRSLSVLKVILMVGTGTLLVRV